MRIASSYEVLRLIADGANITAISETCEWPPRRVCVLASRNGYLIADGIPYLPPARRTQSPRAEAQPNPARLQAEQRRAFHERVRATPAQVRAWARSAGYDVPRHGPLSWAILRAFEQR